MTTEAARPIRIAVVGGGADDPELVTLARDVGRRIAAAGGVVICGGRGGVMAGVARGAADAGGTSIGVLPGSDAGSANPWITIPLPTGLGDGRNVIVAQTAEALIAIGGAWGTLSEVGLARKADVPVILLRPGLLAGLGLPVADSAAEAVDRALEAARRTA